MLALRKRNAPIDPITLKDELKRTDELETIGGPAYLAGLTEGMPRAVNVEHYAQIVKEKAAQRRVIQISNETMMRAYDDGGGDSVALIGNAISELERIARPKAAGFEPPAHWIMRDVADVHSWPCKPIEWVIEDIAAKGNLVWVSADSQTGKTLIGCYNALQLIRGGLLYGRFPINPVGRILYLVLEDPDSRIKDRILDILHGQDPAIPKDRFHTYFASGLNIGDDTQFDYLESLIAKYEVVYLDTYQRATPGILSFDDAKQSLIVHRLSAMTRKHNTLLFVHDHFRVATETRGRHKQEPDKSRTKGTGGKVQNADCVISMDKEGDKIRVKVESKEAGSVKYFMLQISPKGSPDEKFTFIGDLEQMGSDMAAIGQANRQRVFDAIPTDGGQIAREAIEAATGLKSNAVKGHLRGLINDGSVTTNGKKGKAIRYMRANGIGRDEMTLRPNDANQSFTFS